MKKESKGHGSVSKQPYSEESRTITVHPGQAYLGDNRSSSGLGLGDGLVSHTSKWLQVWQAFWGVVTAQKIYLRCDCGPQCALVSPDL